jgi:glyoxylase-like metal-dependent hydrolase (beta-lactamase superfamily II)
MTGESRGFEPVILTVQLPPGVLGPAPAEFDVRCFLVPHSTGIVLIDAGPPGSSAQIGAALERIGGGWADVTDVIVTHAHFDHVGGLAEATELSPQAVVWVAPGDLDDVRGFVGPRIQFSALGDGEMVRQLRALSTPGHTPGHTSLFDSEASTLFLGDLAGMRDGRLQRAPDAFTRDSARNDHSIRRVVELRADRVVPSHGDELADPNLALGELLQGS